MAKGKKNKKSKEIEEMNSIIENVSDENIIEKDEEFIYDIADFFKVFGDSTRLKLLHLLLEKDMCVGDIAEKLSMTQSAVSHQLRVLRQSDLVKFRKEGKAVIYSLDDYHVKDVLQAGISHIGHKKGYIK
ncbi:transcriptional regulator [Tyzzerella sp. An114]|uniref:ArsR/SmtB family transcription factor n=1 Tax=Tyzzerella sp. An114 TaxID=1965545 RepID=UPI000B4300BE|nr:metalloregulator ArsR/SmtB family transcription factor [Tyzzerella sp. An114]OUQ58380.1 transcriptional regulator [Tyzzerella sp. An114]